MKKTIGKTIAAFGIGVALSVAGIGAAQAELAASAPTTASEDGNCLDDLCVGMSVQVVSGSWAGHAGSIVGVDPHNGTVTIVNDRGQYLYPDHHDVRILRTHEHDQDQRYPDQRYPDQRYPDQRYPDQRYPDQRYPDQQCQGQSLCIGDQVQIVGGQYRGYRGQVAGIDAYRQSATILLQNGQYVNVIGNNLQIISRRQQQPRTNPVPQCPPGTIYDVYRGCIYVNTPVPQRRDGRYGNGNRGSTKGKIIKVIIGAVVAKAVL